MNKQDIYNYLKENNIWHEITEHKAVYNMAELAEVDTPYPEADAKNLFVRDDKKKNFYLVSLFVHKNINLKELSEKIPSKRLSFAKQEAMEQMLEVKPGSVTPLAILNNKDKNILMIFDSELQNQTIGMHPMENTATVFLKFEDLYNLLLPHGNEIRILNL